MGNCHLASIFAAFAIVLFSSSRANAHEIRPALLEIIERSPGHFEVLWKAPTRGDMVLSMSPVFPDMMTQVGPPAIRIVPGARIERFTLTSHGGTLVGSEIVIDGLASLQIDVLLRIKLADGTAHSAIIRPKAPSYTVPERASAGAIAWSYMRMGAVHILEGVDHLLFLFALLLLITKFRMLVKTVTAFTLAHSVTLALATLGVVNIPTAPTEAVISLSIVFLATEIIRVRMGKPAFTQSHPWVVALTFGLFHGLGFAGALSNVGVPAGEVPLALLMFNVGVEIGQLGFVIAAVGLLSLLRRVPMPKDKPSFERFGQFAPPYVIGCLAAFWTIERVISFLPPAIWAV